MPKDTEQQKTARSAAMQEGLKKAIEVPLGTMRIAGSAWDMMAEISRIGNIASRSDVEVGARSLETGIWGAYKNVLINLPGIRDEAFKKEKLAEADAILKRSEQKCKECLDILSNRKD